MIKNILFDIGKVFILWEPMDLALSFCPDSETAKKVAQETYLDETWQQLDRGELCVDEVIKLVCEKNEERLHPYLKRAYEFGTFATIVQGTVELAKKLKAEGYNLYFASNYSEKVYDVVERLGIKELFSGHIFSFEEKIVKPSVEFFTLLCSRYGLKPEECVFIDDLPQNIKGAESIGIHGFLYTLNPDEAYDFIRHCEEA